MSKLEKVLFYLFLFLIPSNLAKHWVQNWSYVNGILVDYLIPTLYLTDIIIILILIFWLVKLVRINNSELSLPAEALAKAGIKNYNLKFRIFICFSLFLLFTLYSLLFTNNHPVALYKLIKIIEMVLLVFYIKYNISIKKDIKNISLVLSLSVLWQSLLAIGQWFKQGSIFGYWFFGEQPYNSSTLGIKMINWFDSLKIPPYGTFPHPNVLAGFLTICLILIGYALTNKKLFNLKPNPYNLIPNPYNLLPISLILGTIALFLTFSFPAWFIFLIVFFLQIRNLVYLQCYRLSKILKLILPLAYCLLLIALLFYITKQSWEPTSISRRTKLADIAVNMWLSSPLFGVGLNNFIPRMEEFGSVVVNYRFLQPVHNVYLLILSETGIIGLTLVFSILYLVFRRYGKKNSYILYTLYSILILGLFDHYLFTLQQGLLITALVIGLMLSQSRASQSK